MIFFSLIPLGPLSGLFPHLPRNLLTKFGKLHNGRAALASAIFNHTDVLLPGILTAEGPMVNPEGQPDPPMLGLSLIATLFPNWERSVSCGTSLQCIWTFKKIARIMKH